MTMCGDDAFNMRCVGNVDVMIVVMYDKSVE